MKQTHNENCRNELYNSLLIFSALRGNYCITMVPSLFLCLFICAFLGLTLSLYLYNISIVSRLSFCDLLSIYGSTYVSMSVCLSVLSVCLSGVLERFPTLETDRISVSFSFSTLKLQICQFRLSFVFGPLLFSAQSETEKVFVSCKPSRIF